MQTLRDLHKASLVIDHQLKMPQGQEYSAKTQYGSAYKGNLACSVWQMERGESRDNTLDILAELCFEAVVRAANDYLDECNRAGRYQPPHEHLVIPIIRPAFKVCSTTGAANATPCGGPETTSTVGFYAVMDPATDGWRIDNVELVGVDQ